MIRRATLDDVERLVEIGAQFHAASHWKDVAPLRRDVAGESFASMIAAPQAAVFMSDNGFIAVVAVPLWFSDVLSAQEFCFWTGDGQGDALRRAAEAWAREQGAELMLMGAHEPGPMERLSAWYGRKGYDPHARVFRKVFADGH